MKDAHGYQLTGCNNEAQALLDQSLAQFRCLHTASLATTEAALHASPELVMGHILHAWLYLLGTEAAAVPVAQGALERARALPHNDREGRHLQALALLIDGHWHAAGRTLEDLSIEYPHDLLALQAGHQLDFFTGDARMLRDRIARVLPDWSPELPGYHALLGLYAFGLEETGDYRLAERFGREAIALQPDDAWAQHAVAHVLEMQGRREEGIAWMRGNPAWQQDNMLAVHNWWHLALHYLEQGDADTVLALFDGPVNGHHSTLALELIDASSLLWRLQLGGVDVGERWAGVAERWAAMAADGNYAFNDFHAAMAFASSGRGDLLGQLREAQQRACHRDDDNARFTREVGAPGVEAVVAFVEGKAAHCVDLLRSIRNQAQLFGGSHAQRDLLDQTLIAAARQSGQHSLARALQRERTLLSEQRRMQ
ncbi:tetratricopeptide repeat protein [Stutzerimonas stutzeri]|uniref:tetratricopeptide repeat protein n=1 Tax=Stutzerimonas sp. S1 TaxID=3030652 RepID=UPI00222424F9|nr:tetratricopeptide repeat protein [Stutzerimonas sp. S1]MCW3149430.1 tetratricopeptide repeat protein [Stutzerimonas sp. S1]